MGTSQRERESHSRFEGNETKMRQDFAIKDRSSKNDTHLMKN